MKAMSRCVAPSARAGRPASLSLLPSPSMHKLHGGGAAPPCHRPAAVPGTLRGGGTKAARPVFNRRSRRVAVAARAQLTPSSGGADGDSSDDKNNNNSAEEPLYLPATASTYCAFSAELLLATARLGHLERFREEVTTLYEPGAPVELTRCALLVSNLFRPQLDHRPYYGALEQLLAAATLLVMQRACDGALGGDNDGDDSSGGFEGLDLRRPRHVLCAVRAVNEVLFGREGLAVNAGDPHDPLNGSLADALDTGRGSPWTLAVIWLHLAEGMGLPCTVVGGSEHLFVRVGEAAPWQGSNSSGGAGMPFLVSMTQPGAVYAYPPAAATPPGAAALEAAASLASSSGSGGGSDGSASEAATRDWNSSLHAFLREHRQQLLGEEGGEAEAAGEHGPSGPRWGDAADADADRGSPASSGNWDAAAADAAAAAGRRSEFDVGWQEESLPSGWQELDSSAAEDGQSRNSWKALYGPGALAEWGGSVHSSSLSGSGSFGVAADALSGSPFAAAAQEPFAAADDGAGDGAVQPGASLSSAASSSSSLDTWCGSPGASMDVDDDGAAGGAISAISAGSSGPEPEPEHEHEHDWLAVPQLGWAQAAAAGIGLQPVSKRALLQQLLGGMKLSLMMSGRQEELLMVLRYLRALDPFCLVTLRDTALCLAEERPEEAAPLLREYLAVAPGAADADMVGEVLAQVQLRLQLGRSRGWQ